MKKILLVCLMATALTAASHAQPGSIHINAGADVALPVGNWSDNYQIGFGATAKGLYGISDDGQVGITVGYLHFGMKTGDTEGLSASLGVIPVLALYRHHFGNAYIEPQFGLSHSKATMSVASVGNFGGASSTSLAYAAGLGYLIGDIDLSLRYQGFSRNNSGTGFAALRAAYHFSL